MLGIEPIERSSYHLLSDLSPANVAPMWHRLPIEPLLRLIEIGLQSSAEAIGEFSIGVREQVGVHIERRTDPGMPEPAGHFHDRLAFVEQDRSVSVSRIVKPDLRIHAGGFLSLLEAS